MSNRLDGSAAKELALLKLYMELTGSSEAVARSVFMHVSCRETGEVDLPADNDGKAPWQEQPLLSSLAPSFELRGGWLRTPVAAQGVG